MRFDADKGDRGRVYDANGVLLTHVIRGDTDTGLVERYATDAEGNLLSDEHSNLQRVTQRHPAPLFIKPLETKKTVRLQASEEERILARAKDKECAERILAHLRKIHEEEKYPFPSVVIQADPSAPVVRDQAGNLYVNGIMIDAPQPVDSKEKFRVKEPTSLFAHEQQAIHRGAHNAEVRQQELSRLLSQS